MSNNFYDVSFQEIDDRCGGESSEAVVKWGRPFRLSFARLDGDGCQHRCRWCSRDSKHELLCSVEGGHAWAIFRFCDVCATGDEIAGFCRFLSLVNPFKQDG